QRGGTPAMRHSTPRTIAKGRVRSAGWWDCRARCPSRGPTTSACVVSRALSISCWARSRRISAQRTNGTLARHVGGTFVPSVRLKLAAKGQERPLRRIVMGPYHARALRRRAAEYGLQQLLLAKKQKAVIKASKIPYRPHL